MKKRIRNIIEGAYYTTAFIAFLLGGLYWSAGDLKDLTTNQQVFTVGCIAYAAGVLIGLFIKGND